MQIKGGKNESSTVATVVETKNSLPYLSNLSFQVVAVHVDPSIFDSYYNGCCNGTFWPLFHSMPDRATFIAEHWRAYSTVNEQFAAKTVIVYRFSLAKIFSYFRSCFAHLSM